MLLSAQRVVTPAHAIGVNVFVYLHGPIVWPMQLPQQAFALPVQLQQTFLEVPSGGNTVLSYLDVAVPDGTPGTQLLTAFEEVSDALNALAAMPAGWSFAAYALRWRMQAGLAAHWRHELKDLMRRILLP